jgi:hypothetical protein
MKKISLITLCASAIIPFLWLGMIASISFVEAPLKFRAPGVTVEIGVGIGHLVFTAINKIEWILFTLWLILIAMSGVVHTAFPYCLLYNHTCSSNILVITFFR